MSKPNKKAILIILVMLMVLSGFNVTFIGGNRAYADEVAFAGVTGTALEVLSSAINGVTAPVTDIVPVLSIDDTEYTGTISWSPEDTTFAGNLIYTATVTLTPKEGYTLTGVSENYFTIAGAMTSNSENSGVITAVFPATSAIVRPTITSTIGDVSTGGTANETISYIPNGTTLAAMKSAIKPGSSTFQIYEADGSTVATTLASGQKVIVTSQDEMNRVTYVIMIAEPVAFDGGTGSEDDPFLVATAEQLSELRYHLAAGIYFKLISDIDLSSYSEGKGWLPISHSPGHFRGNLDGNGYTISNLTINRPTQAFIGLFGRTDSSNIRNIILKDIDVRGKSETGGFIGRNKGKISNITVSGSVNSSGDNVGGLAGENYPSAATITNSHSSASVSGGKNVGGLVGYSEGAISNSSSSGNVDGLEFTGGLVGLTTDSGYISDSSATGRVSGGNETGGLVGNNRRPISNSFATGNVQGTTVVGGLTGSNDKESSISSSYAIGSVSGENWTGGLVGRNNGPIRTSHAIGSVSGMEDTGGLTGSNKGLIHNSYATGSVIGTDDVGGLVGENSKISEGNYFSGINDSYATGDVEGIKDVGGLVGANNYKITNSTASGEVVRIGSESEEGFTGGLVGANYVLGSISNSSATGDVTGAGLHYGGLVGGNLGTIRTSFAVGDVVGSYEVGGLVGRSQGAISNSYATGSAEGITDVGGLVGRNLAAPILNSYAIGSVVGTENQDVGGLVGFNGNEGSIITNSYYNSETTLQSDAEKGDQKSTLEMKTLTTYTDWDFSSIWGMLNDGYPFLRELPASTIVGVTVPVTDNVPVLSIDDTEYTGTISWSPDSPTFATNNIYTATVTLTPKEGYTLTGVSENYYTIAGAITSNSADSGVITAVFPATSASAKATITSSIGDVSAGGTANETITNIPHDTTLAALKLAITKPVNATIQVYEADGSTIATTLATGQKVIVIAQDGITKVTYTLTVVTPDLVAPVITLVGAETVNVRNGATYTDAGATALDNIDGDISTAIVLTITKAGDTVATLDTSVAGTYTYSYNVSDTAGNAAEVRTRTVIVANVLTTPPQTPSTPPSISDIITSVNGNLTLPVGSAGMVSFEGNVRVSIPADASPKELRFTIEEVLETRSLVTDQEVLISSVYEILKNFPENFSKPVTLTFIFDPTSLKSSQKAVVFYFDEVNKVWVELGGVVRGNEITVDVDHFTKFAVFVVEKTIDIPDDEATPDMKPTIHLSDILGHWAEANIKQAVSVGIVSGYLDGTFKPSKSVTRAEFAVMLMNALKLQGEQAQLTFTDTASIGAWAKKLVARAVQVGIINGYEDGTFRPDAEITRAEMASMIAIAKGQSIEANTTETGFADDEDIPAWARGAVTFLKQAGIVQGKGENEFAPQDHATRAEAVTIMLNMLGQMSK